MNSKNQVTHWPTEAIREAVVEHLPGFTVEVLLQIDSTNSELMRRARVGRLEPVLLLAEHQTAGRGRLGRQWLSGQMASPGPCGSMEGTGASFAAGPPHVAWPLSSPSEHETAPSGGSAVRAATSPGSCISMARKGATSSLTFSLGLPLAPLDWSGLSLAVGVSVAQSLHPDLRLKWPNDIWWHERKLAGILIETAICGATRYAVVGVGINILPRVDASLATAPAWLGELLPAVDAPQALLRLAAPLVQDIKLFELQGFAPFQTRFNVRDALAGLSVTLSNGTQGLAQGADEVGALRLQSAQGLMKIISAGVSLRPLNLD